MPRDRTATIPFADALRGYGHICAIFPSPEREYHLMLPFIRDGLARGERAVHVVPRDRPDHLERLRDGGIDVEGAKRVDQLAVLTSEELYLRGDHFDPDATLATIEELLDAGQALGFPRTRVVAHAEHVLAHPDDAVRFLEYEIRLCAVLAERPDAIVCAYDLRQIGPRTALELLRAHPRVFVGSVVLENPLFTSPEAYLNELRRRRAYRDARKAPPS